MAVQPWRTGTVIRIENETYNTKRLWIQVPELSRFDFAPGQFVTLDLPIHEKPNKRWRSYSIASSPDATNIFELLVVLLEGGPGSTYLCREVQEGTELVLRGPQGVFTLPQVIEKDLYFICTGTGIAPFRSMLHHIHTHNIAHKNLHLIFGTRKKEDLLYYDEMRQLEAKLEGFQFHPTLSRESWQGHTGYVHEVYKKLIAANSDGAALPEASFFLCGWKAMIDDARKNLAEMGYDKKSVHFELYG